MLNKGFLVVISGPSAVGKGTIVKELLNKKMKDVILSVSSTTREKRVGEEDGINYFFLTEEKFLEKIENNEFIEYAKVHDNYYGTSKKFVEENINNGKIVILEIDVQGALQIRDKKDDVVYIFILPPSLDELKNRLLGRGTETESQMKTRLSNAENELDLFNQYDYFVINNTVDLAASKVESIINSEKYKIKRYSNYKKVLTEEEI